MRIRVECYAGFKGSERPLRFWLGETRHEVEEVVDQWYDPENTMFKVRADDGNLYILRLTPGHDEDLWTLVSFKAKE